MQTIAQRLGKLAADITLGGVGGKLPQANKTLGSGMSGFDPIGGAKAMPIGTAKNTPANPMTQARPIGPATNTPANPFAQGRPAGGAVPVPVIPPPVTPPRPTGGSVTNPLAAPSGALTQALPPPPARSLAQNFEDERAAAANSPQARYQNRNAYKPQQPFSSNPFAAPPPQAPPPVQTLSQKANFLVN